MAGSYPLSHWGHWAYWPLLSAVHLPYGLWRMKMPHVLVSLLVGCSLLGEGGGLLHPACTWRCWLVEQARFVHTGLLAVRGGLCVVRPGGVRHTCVGSTVCFPAGRGGAWIRPPDGERIHSDYPSIHPSIHLYIHLNVKAQKHSLKLPFLTFLSCFRLGCSFSVFLQCPKRCFEIQNREYISLGKWGSLLHPVCPQLASCLSRLGLFIPDCLQSVGPCVQCVLVGSGACMWAGMVPSPASGGGARIRPPDGERIHSEYPSIHLSIHPSIHPYIHTYIHT